MNKLLKRDRLFFDFEFPEAKGFLTAAHLRFEAFSLACQGGTSNQWEKDRLAELMAMPACNAQWFNSLITKEV